MGITIMKQGSPSWKDAHKLWNVTRENVNKQKYINM